MKRLQTLCVPLLILLASGCVVNPPPRPGDPYYAPTASVPKPTPAATAGSLYQGSRGMSLYTDAKARNVGEDRKSVV